MRGAAQPDSSLLPGNYLPSACPGCVIVHRSHELVHSVHEENPEAAELEWDPDSKIFSVVNACGRTRFGYITFTGVDVIDTNNIPFESATNRAEDGTEAQATTFVIVANPHTKLQLGRVEAAAPFAGVYSLSLCNLEPPTRTKYNPTAIIFPLPSTSGPYLCTQGFGGYLTHFFAESYHAIDLRCTVGTLVLCGGDGVVKEVRQSHKCGGISCRNLQVWNSVSVLLTGCGVIVEYLHIAHGSACVAPGDAVRKGQVLCATGDIGFAPEPHIHIELHSADDPDGPSLPLRFASCSMAGSFVPVAGRWYSSEGEVHEPT